MRGFAVSLHHTNQLDAYLLAINQIAELGFNSIEIVTPAFQIDGQSHQIKIESGPNRGPKRRQLLAVLHHARQLGLTTTLMPQVLFTRPRGNEWRGKINPHRWQPWWNSYRNMIDYFLDIANEASVDTFCIGSELLSTERQIQQWQALIVHIRQQFKGRLTYSTNWDHYNIPAFWRNLDMIGVSGYWNLCQGAEHNPPTTDDLTRRWHEIRKKLLDFATSQERPILFTEIGYPSLPWALTDPWNYVHDDHVRADVDAQATGYASFLVAWDDLLSTRPNSDRVAGVYFYAWDPYHRGGDRDTGYGVRGKPAFNLLKQWLTNHR